MPHAVHHRRHHSRRATGFLLLLAIVVSAGAAWAQPPAKLLHASGELVGYRHTFTWTAVPGVTWYYFWLQQPLGVKRIDLWYSAAQAGCDAGEPVCTVTFDLGFTPGEVRWWVGTWAGGATTWSDPQTIRAQGSSAINFSAPLLNTHLGERNGTSTTTGSHNAAVGTLTMQNNRTGNQNTATGTGALALNTLGHRNTALGHGALGSAAVANTDRSDNTAAGANAMRSVRRPQGGVALGSSAHGASVFEDSAVVTAVGARTFNTSSIRTFNSVGLGTDLDFAPIAVGTAGNKVIELGQSTRLGTTHTRTFITAIRGRTTDLPDGVLAVIDSAGQIGTVSSSRRGKERLADLRPVAFSLQRLRPVSFEYTRPSANGAFPTQYGLIAEEVQDVLPLLVARGAGGHPETVKYQILPPLLLAEVQRLAEECAAQDAEIARLEARIAELAGTVNRLRRSP